MAQRSLKTITRTLAALAPLMGFLACDVASTNGRDDLVALRVRLTHTDVADVTKTFSVRRDGPNDVSLEFAWPIADTEAGSLFERAAADVGTGKVPPEFDFTWQVLEDGKQIAIGSGGRGVIGLVDSSEGGLGGGPTTSRALVFGAFPARAGVSYTFRLRPGPHMVPILRASPLLRVEAKVTP